MEVSEFSFRLLVLFLPGIMCLLLIDPLIAHREWHAPQHFVYAFVLGFLCYVLAFPLLAVVQWTWPPRLSFFSSISDSRAIPYSEPLLVTLLASPILALVVSLAVNRRWLHRLVGSIGVSERDSEDVWSSVFGSNIRWATIRDLEHDLVYDGWVERYSDFLDGNELLLRDARAYRNSTGEELYKVDAVYLARAKDSVTIEFRGAELED
jgi:hypothetical protein